MTRGKCSEKRAVVTVRLTSRALFYKEMYKLRPALKIEILAAEGEGPTPVLACSGCFLYLLCAPVPSSGWY